MNEFTIAVSGSGDCRTLTEALVLARTHAGSPVTILLDEGIYRERVVISQDQITLIGRGREKTRISYGCYARELLPDGEKRGTFRTATVLVDGDDFTAQDLTIENTAGPGEKVGQAIALYADGDRMVLDRCDVLGWQDTLFTAPLPPTAIEPNGFRGPKEFTPRLMRHQLYRDCRIRGEVDFIFGGAQAVFERCELISLETGREINGYVTSPSTPEGEEYGYIFRNCRFTGNCRESSVYLGRPWRDWGKVALYDCYLGPHIRPEGWHDWNKPSARDRCSFREYRCFGPGAEGPRADWV